MIECSRGSWGSKIMGRRGHIRVVESFQPTHLNKAVVNEVSINEPLECHEEWCNDDWSWENLSVFRFNDMSKLYQWTGEEEDANGTAKQTWNVETMTRVDKKSCDKISHRLVSMLGGRLVQICCRRLKMQSWGAPGAAGVTSAVCSRWINNTRCNTGWKGVHRLSWQESQSFRGLACHTAARDCSWAGPMWTAKNSSVTEVEINIRK